MPIREFLEAAVARRREHPLLFFEDRQYTYGEFDRACNRAANSFQRRGIRHGERVVLMVGNCPEFLVCWMGLAKLGAIAVPMNPAYKPAEASQILEHADPRLAVATGEQWELLHQLSKSSGGHPELLRMEEVGAGERDVLGPSAVSDDDVAVFIYTSGTTGAPKAVMQTHRTYVLTGEAFPWWLGLTAEDRLLATLPLFHINAQAYSFMGALGAGASLILLPRFSASQFWEQTRRYGATQFNAVGAIVSILAKQPPQPDDADNPVSVCYTALAMSEAEHRAFERRFGLELVVGYGLSESTFGTITPRGAPFPFGTVGRPRQHPSLGRINEARVIDPSTSSGQAGSEAAAGKMGELLLRNPANMRGYFREPELTEQTLLDGWLHTGDAVRRDEGGWFYFVDRRRDVIRRRGENLSSAEVEAVILAHPAVLECAVIGVPSELGEEDVKAFVVLNAGHTLDGDGLVAWCAERLADYKLPRYVEFRTSLPKTPTERVAKHLLRNEELGVRS